VPSLEGKPLPTRTAIGTVLTEFARGALGARDGDQRRVTFADERVLLLSAIAPSESNESLILVIVDETERDRAERAQREFSTNAAHQLRTPVTAIVSSIEMLQTGAKHDPVARDSFLDAIEDQADRLRRLTRALLTLARAEARQEEPQAGRVAIESLLARVVRGADVGAGLDVQVEAESVDAWVDADLLEQALVSVLENASRHTPTGTITLTATHVDDRVRISIADTGGGMTPEERSHAFDRFYRGSDDRDGFGLGLAIARQALTAVGGTIAIDSTPGSGTTVRIEVPAYREAVLA
jgi:signal transduction histidine kinase